MTTYGPKDEWPRHGNDAWNEVLDDARARGWSLEKFTSHRFGALHCPTDECFFPKIDKSAVGTETFAKNHHKKVFRCPHGVEDQQNTVAEVRDRLDHADRYSKAADALIDSEARKAEAEELLRMAEDNVPSVEDIDEAFDLAAWWEVEHAQQAADLLEGTALTDETRVEPVLDAASEEVGQATEALTQLPAQNPEKAVLVDRAEELSERIEAQKVQVADPRTDTPK